MGTELNFNLLYEDENGKEIKLSRLKIKRAFLSECGRKLSHTFVYTNFVFIRKIKK